MTVMVVVVSGDDIEVEVGPAALDSVARRIGDRGDAHRAEAAVLRQLTATEARTLRALADGWSAERVAAATGTSITTVRTHIRNILGKLGVHSQREAVAVAARSGWVRDWDVRARRSATS
jgi:DNA-binding NarL/FixJ family response regulator